MLDGSAVAVEEANADGLAAFQGDATRRDVLRRAEVSKARQIIISLDRDDAAARDVGPLDAALHAVRLALLADDERVHRYFLSMIG